MTNESHCCSMQGEMKRIKVKFTSESALVIKWELIFRCQSKMKVPVARAHCWGMKTQVMVMVSSWSLSCIYCQPESPWPGQGLMPQKVFGEFLGKQRVTFPKGKFCNSCHKISVFIVQISPCCSCFSTYSFILLMKVLFCLLCKHFSV